MNKTPQWKQLVRRAHALAALGNGRTTEASPVLRPRQKPHAPNPTNSANEPHTRPFFATLGVHVAFLIVLGALGCEPVEVYVDPIHDYQDSHWDFPAGEPEVTIGFYSEQLYAPLTEDSPLYITQGFQGGTWSMPAVRTRGIASPAHVACDVMLADGTPVGTTHLDPPTSFQLTTDGWLEVQAYPVPVHETGPTHDAPHELFGLAAELNCTVTDGVGRSDTISLPVFLEQG